MELRNILILIKRVKEPDEISGEEGILLKNHAVISC